jgi:predicted enzyme related to lactoylglutathione lyase
MAHVTSYAAGTPSWVELSTFDPVDAARFYGTLFDWSIVPDEPRRGNRRWCTFDDHVVAGIGPAAPPDESPSWLTHISVADADVTATVIVANGGSLMVQPVDVGDSGRLAVAADPNGAVFAIWQPMTHVGAGIVDEPNTVCWFELTTRGKNAAIAFYDAVFGWRPHHHGDGAADYVEFHLDDQSIAGLLPMVGTWPSTLSNHWTVYFAVDDVDDMTARAVDLGGTVVMPPSEILPGRFAIMNDPQGATFSVLTFHPEAA